MSCSLFLWISQLLEPLEQSSFIGTKPREVLSTYLFFEVLFERRGS